MHAMKYNPIPDERAAILQALSRWVAQRPGFDPHNYTPAGYRADSRRVAQQKADALAMLAAVSWRTEIDAEALKYAFRHAFMGRLEWGGKGLRYCTGQYWCTEYRAAACAVLAMALWHYWREQTPATAGKATHAPGVVNVGDAIRRTARNELGRGIASRWFN